MNLFVLYRDKSSPSARALTEAIKEQTEDLQVIRGTVKSKYLRLRKFDYILNVGNSLKCNFKGAVQIINHPDKIRTSANKKLARMRFKARKIPAPTLWLEAHSIPDYEFPVVGRTSYHMKATGFWYCKNKTEALSAQRYGATHFMKFIKNTREFRAHVFSTTLNPENVDDYVIGKLSEKKGSENAKDTIIKNYDNGYRFVSASNKEPYVLEEVRELAKLAAFNFGLHYGGIDIIYSKDTGKTLILEINTTPCLTDDVSSTLDIYASKFIDLIGAKRVDE